MSAGSAHHVFSSVARALLVRSGLAAEVAQALFERADTRHLAADVELDVLSLVDLDLHDAAVRVDLRVAGEGLGEHTATRAGQSQLGATCAARARRVAVIGDDGWSAVAMVADQGGAPRCVPAASRAAERGQWRRS